MTSIWIVCIWFVRDGTECDNLFSSFMQTWDVVLYKPSLVTSYWVNLYTYYISGKSQFGKTYMLHYNTQLSSFIWKAIICKILALLYSHYNFPSSTFCKKVSWCVFVTDFSVWFIWIKAVQRVALLMIDSITLLLFKAKVQGGHSDILVYTYLNIGLKNIPKTSLAFPKKAQLNKDFAWLHIKFNPLNLPFFKNTLFSWKSMFSDP